MKDIKVGVGVITVGTRPLKDYIVTYPGAEFIVQYDENREGVSLARNRLMKKFYDQGFDYWFIFDDDCYPVYPGWEKYFIDQAIEGGWDFFGMPEYFKEEVISSDKEIVVYKEGLCQFAMYSRAVVEKAGYYRIFSHGYGFEDSEYIKRIPAAGLNKGVAGVVSPLRVMAYIHPDDVFGNNPTPYANLTKEEKGQGIETNWNEYLDSLKDLENGKTYVSFEEAKGNADD